MESQDREIEKEWKDIQKAETRGKVMGGLVIITIGSLFLAKELGVELPAWLLTWKMLIVAVGVVTAVKHRFMHPVWIPLVLIGGAFVLNDIYPEMAMRPFLWPVLIIMAGLFMVFKPSRRSWHKHHMRDHLKRQHMRAHWKQWHDQHHRYRDCKPQNYWENVREEPIGDNYIDSTACFAGIKKNILSKKFRGGEVTSIFGGTELNLMQADLDEKATLEVTTVLGGTTLIVPAHWEIKSPEIVTILGHVEDKRPPAPRVGDEATKVLTLIGTIVMGGIEIRTEQISQD